MNIVTASFLENFVTLNDLRIERSKEDLLKYIIAITILAIISGADGWVTIEAYGNAKDEWLKSFLELPNGIPSHDRFSRVFSRIEPPILRTVFIWPKGLCSVDFEPLWIIKSMSAPPLTYI
ncbi:MULTISPECIES: transposase family protein [unclassified Microcoleus]|uniref:transposase family protein n=1 Tax=unclassified Microcoleus TaxID=2642155 RepID=UPI002FD72422